MDDKHRFPWLVLHVPHSATHIPFDLRPQLLLDDEGLALEQLRMTDHFTDELFMLATLSTRVVFPVSRLVVDPERFRDDASEAMAERGMGAIYEKTANGERLRWSPSPEAREGLLARFYDPHHRTLESAVRGALDAHSFCLVLDCHSFPGRALAYEADQSALRPEICIGTDEFHTPSWLCELAVAAFAAAGFDVAVNRPFAGALVPASQHRARRDVMALMIEIRRDLYIDEDTGERRPNFAAFKRRLIDLLDDLCSRVCNRRGSARWSRAPFATADIRRRVLPGAEGGNRDALAAVEVLSWEASRRPMIECSCVLRPQEGLRPDRARPTRHRMLRAPTCTSRLMSRRTVPYLASSRCCRSRSSERDDSTARRSRVPMPTTRISP